jgi:hypothetical protein
VGPDQRGGQRAGQGGRVVHRDAEHLTADRGDAQGLLEQRAGQRVDHEPEVLAFGLAGPVVVGFGVGEHQRAESVGVAVHEQQGGGAAVVVADHVRAVNAERIQETHDGLGNLGQAVVLVQPHGGVAQPGQVGGQDPVVAGQPGDDVLPFQGVEGAAVQQQHRVAAAFVHVGEGAGADVQVALALRPVIQAGLAGHRGGVVTVQEQPGVAGGGHPGPDRAGRQGNPMLCVASCGAPCWMVAPAPVATRQ